MPRPQHYEFAQHTLAEEIGLDPHFAWAALNDAGRSAALLAEWWGIAHLYSGTSEAPLPATGLRAVPCEVGDRPGVLITLPPPQEVEEAWLALVVLPEVGPPRCLLLEMAAGKPRPEDVPSGQSAATDLTATYICERSPETSTHHNHGRGPAAFTPQTAPEFMARVARLLAGDTLTPARR